jgi:glutathione reductase (NADPH)
VELVYRQPLPLRGFDADLRSALAEALVAQGIALRPDAAPTRVTQTETGLSLELTTNFEVEADCVFFATGRVPNTEGLGLEAAGVELAANGAVVVDEDKRSSVPHIFAIGDVTDRMNLTPVATAEGHALADTLFGSRPRRPGYDSIPTAVFSTPPVSTVGLTEEEAARIGPADIYVTRFTPMRHTLTGRQRRTMMKLVVCQRTQRVLGAHMIGEDAPEIVQGLAIAINAGATKADFDRTIGIHPTAAEEFVTLRTRTRVAGEREAAE